MHLLPCYLVVAGHLLLAVSSSCVRFELANSTRIWLTTLTSQLRACSVQVCELRLACCTMNEQTPSQMGTWSKCVNCWSPLFRSRTKLSRHTNQWHGQHPTSLAQNYPFSFWRSFSTLRSNTLSFASTLSNLCSAATASACNSLPTVPTCLSTLSSSCSIRTKTGSMGCSL